MTEGKLVFVDIETTGLSLRDDFIIEVGLAAYSSKLELVDSYAALIVGGENSEAENLLYDRAANGNSYVLDMHKSSGLLSDWSAANDGVPPSDSTKVLNLDFCNPGEEIVKVLDSWGMDKKAPMCGSSVHFDRSFLKFNLPEVEARFGYRNMDASSMMELLRITNPELLAEVLDSMIPARLHRSLSDIQDSVDLVKALIGALKSDEVVFS